jgi:hypothetical protein
LPINIIVSVSPDATLATAAGFTAGADFDVEVVLEVFFAIALSLAGLRSSPIAEATHRQALELILQAVIGRSTRSYRAANISRYHAYIIFCSRSANERILVAANGASHGFEIARRVTDTPFLK